MRQNDPVLFMEPKRIYRESKGEVPDTDYTIELGKASIVREGTQCTLLAWSGMVSIAEEAAKELNNVLMPIGAKMYEAAGGGEDSSSHCRGGFSYDVY